MGCFFNQRFIKASLDWKSEDLFFFASKEVLAREYYQYLYRLLKDKLSLTSSLENILFVYQPSFLFDWRGVFFFAPIGYKINHIDPCFIGEISDHWWEKEFSSLWADLNCFIVWNIFKSFFPWLRFTAPLFILISVFYSCFTLNFLTKERKEKIMQWFNPILSFAFLAVIVNLVCH